VTEETNPRRPRRTARRAVTALAAAGVAALALSACQVQPGAAAFVGGDRISRTEVDKVTDNVPASVKANVDFAGLREKTVAALVAGDLAGRVAKEQGITVKAADYQGAAQRIGLPASNGYVRAVAQADANINALRSAAQPGQLSPTDLEYLLQVLMVEQVVDASATVDQYKDQLESPEAKQTATVRDELTAAAKKYHVTINPLYGQVVYGIKVPYGPQVNSDLPLLLGKATTSPVVLASATPSPGE
jgi:hypothetical protein